MSASNHKVGSPINVWQSLANKFINQSSQLKVYWDKVGEIVREKHDALCDYIDSYIATKQELQDVTIGLIPDGTVTQDKLAPSLKDSLPAQYVRNRIPTYADNFASGHKIGDAWYIPDITLNNLVPTPLAINTADFTIQNANASVSGSAVTLSCLGGFDFASFKRTITPVAGALYVLFAELKLTSTHVLTSLSLNDQVIASPVKDTVYHVACVVTAPTEIEIKAQALTGPAINGATVVIDKLTIVNMTADMDGVPFDKAGAEAYFQVNPAFLAHKFNNARTRWYCSDNGVWQSSSQLSDETKALYGAENVDDALKRAIVDFSSYQAFCANVNVNSIDSALGKGNEDRIKGLGLQMAMYAWFKGLNKSAYPFINLLKKHSYLECLTGSSGLELLGSVDITSLLSNASYIPCESTLSSNFPNAYVGLGYLPSKGWVGQITESNSIRLTVSNNLVDFIKYTTNITQTYNTNGTGTQMNFIAITEWNGKYYGLIEESTWSSWTKTSFAIKMRVSPDLITWTTIGSTLASETANKSVRCSKLFVPSVDDSYLYYFVSTSGKLGLGRINKSEVFETYYNDYANGETDSRNFVVNKNRNIIYTTLQPTLVGSTSSFTIKRIGVSPYSTGELTLSFPTVSTTVSSIYQVIEDPENNRFLIVEKTGNPVLYNLYATTDFTSLTFLKEINTPVGWLFTKGNKLFSLRNAGWSAPIERYLVELNVEAVSGQSKAVLKTIIHKVTTATFTFADPRTQDALEWYITFSNVNGVDQLKYVCPSNFTLLKGPLFK